MFKLKLDKITEPKKEQYIVFVIKKKKQAISFLKIAFQDNKIG
jgi:hypothetical protein